MSLVILSFSRLRVSLTVEPTFVFNLMAAILAVVFQRDIFVGEFTVQTTEFTRYYMVDTFTATHVQNSYILTTKSNEKYYNFSLQMEIKILNTFATAYDEE